MYDSSKERVALLRILCRPERVTITVKQTAGEEKRKRIVDAALVVFAREGLQRSSIAEIARCAGVTDSIIYQYFKGKEDLLFSIPDERMPEQIALLEESLQGIRDAENRLSKMIWFHLRRNQVDAPFARLLLLECRSNKEFYGSQAYKAVRSYAAVLLRLLEDGVREGIFRDDVDMRLVRDIIFGTLDFEGLSFLVTKEINDPAISFESIMSLVLPMIRKCDHLHEKAPDKQEKILLAAEHVFSEKGFVRSRISEVAARAQVAEGTIYEYFKNKEDLLLSIPDKRFGDHVEQLEETFEIKTPARKLRRLIGDHFSLYLTNRNFLRVFIIQIQLSERFYKSRAFETFQVYLKVIERTIEEGKFQGIFRPDVDSRVFRNMFLGTFSHMALRWFILGKEPPVDKMREIDQITDLLSRSVIADAP